MYPHHPASWPPPQPPRNRKDVTATVLLSIAQLVMSGAAALFAAGLLVWLTMPICSDDCDSPNVNRFVHHTLVEAAVLGGGIVVALPLAGVGVIVAAKRRSLMWKWPALGLGVVVASYCVSAGMWLDSLPSGR